MSGSNEGEPPSKKAKISQDISVEEFGQVDGQNVSLYTIKNSQGCSVKITNYGATVTAINVLDREGQLGDVVLGFDSVEGYLSCDSFLGCTVGRYANRIAKGKFSLGGTEYSLATNNGPNALHGGLKGFDKCIWNAEIVGDTIKMTYTSPDMEEGYPGTMDVSVQFAFSESDELSIQYTATTDKDTVVNLTNHSYFNLSGDASKSVLGHRLHLNADKFTPVDPTCIPLGELRGLDDSPLDFRQETTIGDRIDGDDEQLKNGAGYDHNYVINNPDKSRGEVFAARVFEPETGRVLEVLTSEPGIQFYSGNWLEEKDVGKGGKAFARRGALCLETQHFPDSPNQPSFPSTLLKAGDVFSSSTTFCFRQRI